MSYLETILTLARDGKHRVEIREPAITNDRYWKKIVLIDNETNHEDPYPLSRYEYEQYELRTKGDRK